MMRTSTASATEIQRGDKTQTQSQSILSRSLRTIKTIVRRPAKPIPPPAFEEELFDIISSF